MLSQGIIVRMMGATTLITIFLVKSAAYQTRLQGRAFYILTAFLVIRMNSVVPIILIKNPFGSSIQIIILTIPMAPEKGEQADSAENERNGNEIKIAAHDGTFSR